MCHLPLQTVKSNMYQPLSSFSFASLILNSTAWPQEHKDCSMSEIQGWLSLWWVVFTNQSQTRATADYQKLQYKQNLARCLLWLFSYLIFRETSNVNVMLLKNRLCVSVERFLYAWNESMFIYEKVLRLLKPLFNIFLDREGGGRKRGRQCHLLLNFFLVIIAAEKHTLSLYRDHRHRRHLHHHHHLIVRSLQTLHLLETTQDLT